MTESTTGPHGTVHWSELMTRDVEASKAFYAKLCGWEYQTVPMGEGGADYTLAMQGERPVAGLFPVDEEMPQGWMTYLAVADVDAAVEAASAAGGTIHRPPFDVPNTGRIAIIGDIGGSTVGLMTPEPMPEG